VYDAAHIVRVSARSLSIVGGLAIPPRRLPRHARRRAVSSPPHLRRQASGARPAAVTSPPRSPARSVSSRTHDKLAANAARNRVDDATARAHSSLYQPGRADPSARSRPHGAPQARRRSTRSGDLDRRGPGRVALGRRPQATTAKKALFWSYLVSRLEERRRGFNGMALFGYQGPDRLCRC
jgi:hypothetical protein